MATTRGDRRHVRTIGTPPNVGRRYVSRGKVRIEWAESGRRRQRTIGDDSVDRRREADRMLAQLLGMDPGSTASEDPTPPHQRDSLVERLRAVALAGLDLADAIADRLRSLTGSPPD